ncbi:MAG: hypothetical protein JJU20_09310 [Opitutales bacterium]|nr:hypothetical protein [Opitutales bacterium]
MTDLPIYFETKDWIGLLILIPSFILASSILMTSQRLRELALFLVITGTVFAVRLDISVYGAHWYRGTTRGFEITFIDVLAVSLLFSTILITKGKRFYWPASLSPMLLYFFFAVCSVAFIEPRIFGFYELHKMLRGLMFFLLAAFCIRSKRDLSIVIAALCVAVSIEAIWALRQRIFLGIERTPGTLEHANSLSMYLCMVTPVLVAAATSGLSHWLRWFCWITVAAATMGMALTISRAGIPIFITVVGGAAIWSISWKPTITKVTAIAVVILGFGFLTLQSWDSILERYQEASFEDEYLDEENLGRGYYFRQADVILTDRAFGVGLNNWSYWVSNEYGRQAGQLYHNYAAVVYDPNEDFIDIYRFAAPAHNLGLLTVGELGWAGLALFSILWLRWFHIGAGFLKRRVNESAYQIGFGVFVAMIGLFLHSFTEWTYRQAEIFITFNLLLGMLVAIHHYYKTRDHEDSTVNLN